MPNISVFGKEGQEIEKIDLSDSVFGVEINTHVVHLALKRQLANARRGCACTKTRGEVRGGGKKPWRQKGTGRARHGSRRSPVWKGGGVIFGPKPRDFSLTLPKKVRRLALKSVLTSKLNEGKCKVVDSISIDSPKTKSVVEFLDRLNLENTTLIVIPERDVNLEKSARNLSYAKVILAVNLNIHDILTYDNLVLTKGAVKTIEEVLL
jgi:large subunit ribosomal protein L4